MEDACNESDFAGIYIAGMFKKLTYILCILLAASCAKEDGCMLTGEGTVIISGLISDKDTGVPLKEAKITYEAYNLNGKLIETKTSYSSDNGMYAIESDGYTSEITCILSASDAMGGYTESKIELNIDWNGSMFNTETETFVINDCNFYLQKQANQ